MPSLDLIDVQVDVHYNIGIGLFHGDLKLALGSARREQIRSKFPVTGVSAWRRCMNRRVDSVNHADLDCPMAEWATFSA